jgi:hypothetical protein
VHHLQFSTVLLLLKCYSTFHIARSTSIKSNHTLTLQLLFTVYIWFTWPFNLIHMSVLVSNNFNFFPIIITEDQIVLIFIKFSVNYYLTNYRDVISIIYCRINKSLRSTIMIFLHSNIIERVLPRLRGNFNILTNVYIYVSNSHIINRFYRIKLNSIFNFKNYYVKWGILCAVKKKWLTVKSKLLPPDSYI